jgi:hypothetical protein
MEVIKSNNENSFPIIFPELIERHEKCKPNKEAYFFFPKEDELMDMEYKNQKNWRRKIFEIKGDRRLSDFENTLLESLYQEIKNQNSINTNSQLNIEGLKESEILRFLQSTSFDIKETIRLLKEHVEWKKTHYPLKINKNVEQILNKGVIYIHGRDNHFRPIIVINAQKYMEYCKKYTYNDFILSVIYLIDYTIQNILIPGQIEQWITIADLRNFSILTMPSDLRKLFYVLQFHYRARLHVIYVVGMNPVLNALWSIVRNLIDSHTNKKIRFIKNNNKDEMFEFINREQLEEKYGGFAPNVSEEFGFFPPIMPSKNYLKDFDHREEMLVSEEKYKEKYEKGQITILTPFYEEIYSSYYKRMSICDGKKIFLFKVSRFIQMPEVI